MYIHRIILRDVKSIDHLDITLHDDWRNEPLKSILLTGPNGSGKTTILKVIAALWENFGKRLHQDAWKRGDPELPELLLNVGLAAIEIYDLAPKPLWLCIAYNGEHSIEFNNMLGGKDALVAMQITGLRYSPNNPL